MPFQTPFAPNSGFFDGTITATAHEHGSPDPTTIIKTTDSWAVNVTMTNTGLLTPMVGGTYDLHLLLERIGPGTDLDLTDPFLPDHRFSLTPTGSYFKHVDVAANVVPAGVYKLVVLVRYFDLSNQPGPVAAYEEISPLLQFYAP